MYSIGTKMTISIKLPQYLHIINEKNTERRRWQRNRTATLHNNVGRLNKTIQNELFLLRKISTTR